MAKKDTAGRNALAPAEQVGPEFIGRTDPQDAAGIEALHQHQQALVDQYGDGLPWQPEHYEAAIRQELRRGCEAFIRAGRYLLVARECALHGEWQGMLDRLGLSRVQASRMTEAARRISILPNVSTSKHLIEAAKYEGKLIELLSLPEDKFAELAEHGETDGLSIDDVEDMTVRELRAAVREARSDLDAKDQRISKLSDDLNKEHEKLAKAQRRWKSATPDDQLVQLQQAVTEAEQNVLAAIGSESAGFRAAVATLAEHADSNGLDTRRFLGDTIGRLLTALRIVRDDDELPFPIPRINDGEED